MKKSLSRSEAEKQIEDFFENVKNKSQDDVKKIKRLSMSYKIKLGNKRKLFCGKCLTPYNKSKIRIKNKTKIIVCENCEGVSRWKIK